MEREFKLYFEDLTPEAQKRLLETAGVEKPIEMNWDVFPIAVIECYQEGEY